MIDLSVLEAKVKSLNDSLGTVGILLAISTFAVVIGLVIEYAEDFCGFGEAIGLAVKRRAWWPLRILDKKAKRAVCGGMLVVLGVGFEQRYEWQTSKLEGDLEGANDQIVTQLGGDAQQLDSRLKSATEAATKAEDASTKAFDKADKANISASRSLAVARDARQEADTFENDIKTARKEARDALANLADAKRLAEYAQKETTRITDTLADRALSPVQISDIATRLRPFAGQEFGMVAYWDSKESMGITNQIYQSLLSGGWQYLKPASGEMLLGGIVGVFINVHPNADRSTAAAAQVLVDALLANGIAAEVKEENPVNNPKHNKIHLTVGSKR